MQRGVALPPKYMSRVLSVKEETAVVLNKGITFIVTWCELIYTEVHCIVNKHTTEHDICRSIYKYPDIDIASGYTVALSCKFTKECERLT